MTPAEHAAASMLVISELEASQPRSSLSQFDFEVARIHAILSRCLGSGDHYSRASSLLNSYAEKSRTQDLLPATALRATRIAALHAELAERA